MAGWLLLVDDSGVVVGVQYDIARRRFEAFVVVFLKEIFALYCFHFFPPMLVGGKQVDLFKLFTVVKDKGGYDTVCDEKLWDWVGEESGLGVSVGLSVKLVYSKYLRPFEAWVKKVTDSKVSSERSFVDNRDEFRRRLMELQAEVKGFLSDHDVDNVVAGEEFKLGGVDEVKSLNLESNEEKEVKNGGCHDSEMPDRVMINESILGKLCEGNDAMEVVKEVDGGKLFAELAVDVSDVVNSSKSGLLSEEKKRGDDSGDDCAMVLDPSSVDRESFGLKRKRESMFDLLSWVTGAAKNPCDPAVGSMPEKPKWKSYSNQEVWKQVLLFREAAFNKKSFESSSERQNWQGQKMHPSIYEEHLSACATYNLRERLKRDKKLVIGKHTSSLQSSSGSSVGAEGDLDRTPSPYTESRAKKPLLDFSNALAGIDTCAMVRIPVGPTHQAEVPEWTGKTSESDSKWLGTQIWPLEKGSSRLLIERDPIGKGRQDSCGCTVPGSVECVRFHIAEKRAKLKLELGAAFYQWNFDKVGEDVRHLWTDEEEKKFKDVVESNPPSSESYFWDNIFRTFPNKSRADLVSYYFNVFLLQRRGYQNRHTPDNIDSDDDESECGLRNVFGHRTQTSRGSILLTPKKPDKGKIASECLSKSELR